MLIDLDIRGVEGVSVGDGVRRPGERRDYYEPETSIWKMVSRVFRERELVHIREAISAFEAAQKLVQAVEGTETKP